jgi:hypothetical protein
MRADSAIARIRRAIIAIVAINPVTSVAIVRARRAVTAAEVLVAHTIEWVLTIPICTRPASGAHTKVAGRAAIVRASRAASVGAAVAHTVERVLARTCSIRRATSATGELSRTPQMVMVL